MTVLATTAVPAQGTHSEHYKVADGISVYLGVVPSELIRAHRDQYPAGMHGGVPRRASYHHVMIALFDNKTGKRINDATVTASVEEVGATSQQKQLEPMAIAGTITYGNYFTLSGDAVYRIHLQIKLPGNPQVIKTELGYHHVHQGM